MRERLALFVQVCRAVEAAHRALIVHRDLKPSNVFVTADGNVKLLDFGIAKLLQSDDDEHTRSPMLTPAYAAPEQHASGPITTATDVYALGVLLGELVTGQRLNGADTGTPSSRITEDVGRRRAAGNAGANAARGARRSRQHLAQGARCDSRTPLCIGRRVRRRHRPLARRQTGGGASAVGAGIARRNSCGAIAAAWR